MSEYLDKALKLRKWVKVGHHIPGRIRLKYKLGIVAQLATYRSDEIEQSLTDFPALKQYKINKSTGSIVIEYDAELLNPASVDDLFSASDGVVEQAFHAITKQLNLNGD